jgi:hypothetical protein
VQRAPGLPCSLFHEGRWILQNSGELCRENADTHPDVIARLDRATQYSGASVIKSIGRGVPVPPVEPGMTAVCGAQQRHAASLSLIPAFPLLAKTLYGASRSLPRV